jgi:hypothetical protein
MEVYLLFTQDELIKFKGEGFNMNKIKIQSMTKIIFISILISLSIILFMLQFFESKNYKTVDKETELYDYVISSNTKYNVKLFNNTIFENNTLPQDGVYITSLVDDIELNIINTFSGNEKVKIKGKYDITATMKGIIAEQDITKVIWSKLFKLKNNMQFYVTNDKNETIENLIIDYDWFSNISKEINESTKISTNNVLEVTMNIEYDVETKHGIVKEIANPTVIIPLSSNYFTPTSSNIADIANNIKKTDKEIIEPNHTIINIYRIFIAIILIIIILLFTYTVKPSEYDMYIKKINNIFKNYSKLLVGVKSSNNLEYNNIYYVKNFNDLIKISEEIEKPIFYSDTENLSNINKFYIINENVIYIYYVKPIETIISSDKLEDLKTT